MRGSSGISLYQKSTQSTLLVRRITSHRLLFVRLFGRQSPAAVSQIISVAAAQTSWPSRTTTANPTTTTLLEKSQWRSSMPRAPQLINCCVNNNQPAFHPTRALRLHGASFLVQFAGVHYPGHCTAPHPVSACWTVVAAVPSDGCASLTAFDANDFYFATCDFAIISALLHFQRRRWLAKNL